MANGEKKIMANMAGFMIKKIPLDEWKSSALVDHARLFPLKLRDRGDIYSRQTIFDFDDQISKIATYYLDEAISNPDFDW